MIFFYLEGNFPLPFIDVTICVNTKEMMSLMDGFFGYNQIMVIGEDQPKSAFIVP
jgi:hypothetical protein